MLELLQTLQELSPLAVIALLAIIIYVLVIGRRDLALSRRDVSEIKDNHQHEIVAALIRIETRLIAMNDCLVWIKARLNGQQ